MIAQAIEAGQPVIVEYDAGEDLAETVGQQIRERRVEQAACDAAAVALEAGQDASAIEQAAVDAATAAYEAPTALVPHGTKDASAKVDHCVNCGCDFHRFQARQTCGSEAACQRRQAARQAAAA